MAILNRILKPILEIIITPIIGGDGGVTPDSFLFQNGEVYQFQNGENFEFN
jgi:hypothetical protein